MACGEVVDDDNDDEDGDDDDDDDNDDEGTCVSFSVQTLESLAATSQSQLHRASTSTWIILIIIIIVIGFIFIFAALFPPNHLTVVNRHLHLINIFHLAVGHRHCVHRLLILDFQVKTDSPVPHYVAHFWFYLHLFAYIQVISLFIDFQRQSINKGKLITFVSLKRTKVINY